MTFWKWQNYRDKGSDTAMIMSHETFVKTHRMQRVNPHVNYELWLIIMYQCWFIICNKCITPMQDVKIGETVNVGTRGKISIFYKPVTALKNIVY